ncbi:MAG: hypothetical protein RLZZ584_1438 [Pseudomonadota bacterium]
MQDAHAPTASARQQRHTPTVAPAVPLAGRRRGPSWPVAVCGAGLAGWLAMGSWAATPAPAAMAAAGSPPQARPVAQARVIVKYRASAAVLLSTLAVNGQTPQARALAATGASPMRHAATLGARLGLVLQDGRTIAPRTQVLYASGLDSQQLAERLRADPDVEVAAPDQRRHALAAPNDPLYPAGQANNTPATGQWYLRKPNGTIVSSVDAEAAWDVSPGSIRVVVAMLDTGVLPAHPDLAGKLLPGYDFISSAAISGADGTARDNDPTDPGDWMTAAEVANTAVFGRGCVQSNSSWHGTQTAGLVGAATSNGVGMAGLGRQVMLLPLRVLGKCGGFDSDIIAAMRWASGIGIDGVPANPTPARVVNLSLGAPASCSTSATANPGGAGAAATAQLYVDAIAELRQRGTAVVVAAGNDSLGVNMPANCPGAIAVAGLRHAGTKNGFSSLGPEVAIAAPGGNCPSTLADKVTTNPEECQYPMLSTVNSGTTAATANGYRYSNSFDGEVGTSFSTPLVSATAALMFSAYPALGVADMLTIMQRSTRPFPTTGGGDPLDVPVPVACVAGRLNEQSECYCTTGTCGAGMLDAGAALRAVAALVTVPSFTASADHTTPGTTVALYAGGIQKPAANTITGYRWDITAGSDIASFLVGTASATTTTGASASLATTAGKAGTVTVQLTVTDNTGDHSTSQNIVVGQPVSTPVSSTPTTGGGGGAFAGLGGLLWLGGLALGVLALARQQRQAPARSRRSGA